MQFLISQVPFDRSSFFILFMKLRRTELPFLIIRLLQYMLRNVFANVSFNVYKVSNWLISYGARQGRILSPLLFNAYVSEIIEYALLKCVRCRLRGVSYDMICYLSVSKAGLQILLDYVSGQLREVRLKHEVSIFCYIVFMKNKFSYIILPQFGYVATL